MTVLMDMETEMLDLTAEKKHSARFQLFDQANNEDLEWPLEAKYERDFISPFLSSGSQTYISNVQTRMYVLKTGSNVLPITINDKEYDNANVCSPFTKYVTYGKRELKAINNIFLKLLASFPLSSFGTFLKAGKINQVACINNWLVATNLYPNMNGVSIREMTPFLIDAFPNHTIMFPSLNQHANAPLMCELQECGYQLIPTRKVFILDQSLKNYTKERNTQNDFALLKKTPYQIVTHDEINEFDYGRIAELYHYLYIQKYSDCNPKFTPELIKLFHIKKLLNLQGLRRKEGDLVAIIGTFHRNGVLANPLVGYDTQLPISDGLYRLVTALSIKEAFDKGLIYNMSAGVSEFKKKRGGIGYIEYNAVFHKHLPFHQRQPWNILHFMMNKIGVPFLHNYI